ETIAKGIDAATAKLESFKKAFKSVAAIDQSTSPILDSGTAIPAVDAVPATPTETSYGGALGSIKKTIEAIKLVRTEFDITSSFAGKKIDELGKKAMDAGI